MSNRNILGPGTLLFKEKVKALATAPDRLATTAPLDNGSTWTSDWVDVSAYETLIVAAKTDQNGIFYVDFSPDGTNVDSTLSRYYNTGNIEAPHRWTVTRQYARIRFTNDSGSNQTYLRLQTLLGNHPDLNAPVDSTLARDFDSTVTRPTNFYHEVARGLRQGSTIFNKFGYNNDVDTGTEVIASFGGSYTPPTTATTLTIVSSSTADDGDPAGTGANSIQITGVDANRAMQTEVVTLNGISNVVTTTTWLGINRAAVALAGSGQANAGTITITATTGGANLAQIPVGEGTTQQAIYHNEIDHVVCAEELSFSAIKTSGGGNPEIFLRGWAFSPVSNCKYEVFRAKMDIAKENNLVISPKIPFVLNSGDVLWFECETDTDDTAVSCRFSLVDYADVDSDDL